MPNGNILKPNLVRLMSSQCPISLLMILFLGRQYKSQLEEQQRMQNFFNNLDLIDQHNAQFKAGKSSFEMGVTKFADMTNEEYQSVMLSPRDPKTYRQDRIKPKHAHVRDSLKADPDSVDWRPLGYVTPVKDQGQCGSCWSFSTTGVLEGAIFKATGVLTSLSEQNLMDCSSSYGNAGCNGGMQEYAVDYIVANGGIDTEESYPYEERDGKCRYDAANNAATCDSYTSILPRGDEIVQRSAVATVGPVSFSMDASKASFQLYANGVYTDPLCKNGFFDLDHAVLGVGYGNDGTQDYWIVKNSWGTGWGLDGYFWIYRGNNTCGIATDSLYVNGARLPN
ncbi:hypothetical protein CHUAL_005028 [Chamberlinius hualienensis]